MKYIEKELLEDAANIYLSNGYLTEAKAFYENANDPQRKLISKLAGEVLSLRARVESLEKENAALAACGAVAMLCGRDQCMAMGQALGRHVENRTQGAGGLQ